MIKHKAAVTAMQLIRSGKVLSLKKMTLDDRRGQHMPDIKESRTYNCPVIKAKLGPQRNELIFNDKHSSFLFD